MDKSEVFRENGFGLNCLFNTISTEQLKAIFDAMPSSVFIINADGQFLYVNKRGLELNGIEYSGFEMEKNISLLKALRPDGSPFPSADMLVTHSLKSGQVVCNVEMIIENVNGIRYPVNVSSTPMTDNHGKMSGAVVLFENFTVHEQKFKELIESEVMISKAAEDKYRMLFNTIDQGFFIIDVFYDENERPIDMYYVEANSAANKILGRDYTGMRLRDIDPKYEEYWFEIFGKVALTGQSIRMEQYADPDKKWYSFYIFRIGDDKSRRIGNIFMDITERKQMEKENIEAKERLAQNAEEKYRMLFETMEEGFCTIDVIFNVMGKAINWRYLETNLQFVNQVGLPEVAGKLVSELYPKVEDIWFDFYGNVALSGVAARMENQVEILNKWYDVYAFKIGGGPESRKVGVLFRDITTRKLADEALRNSERKYHDLFDSIDEGFCVIEVLFDHNERPIDYRFLEVNQAFERQTRLVDAEGRCMRDLAPNHEQQWFDIYGHIALTGEPKRFQNSAVELGFIYDVYAFRVGKPEQRRVAIIFNDIKERKLSEEALCKSEKNALDLVEKLHQADQNKNVFINMLSHELRNPLAAIMMSLDLLEKAPAGGKQAEMAHEVAKRQGKQLTHLVDDLLDVTRITKNKITLKKEIIELNELIKNEVQDYQSQFIDNGVGLEVNLTSPVYIEADPSRITQVIGNLLNNAAKFTSKDDQVIVTVSQDTNTNEAVITVQDTGCGIDTSVLENIFEPFMQVDKSLVRSLGGLGLGLYIVKGIVELHGGRVEVFSEGIGKGTKFTIRLMLPKGNIKEQECCVGVEAMLNESLEILMIDDNKDLTEIMCELIVFLGHKATSAHNGNEGVLKARELRPDVVICDIGLPDMSGYEVAKIIRKDTDLKDIFLIAMSGYAQPEDIKRSKEACFDRYLSKPVTFSTLEMVLNDVKIKIH